MSSPINRMIDASVSCLRCGKKGLYSCDCWVKLVCTKCGDAKYVAREPDFFDFKEVETLCPNCRPPRNRCKNKGNA